jgi:hypothetical protein
LDTKANENLDEQKEMISRHFTILDIYKTGYKLGSETVSIDINKTTPKTGTIKSTYSTALKFLCLLFMKKRKLHYKQNAVTNWEQGNIFSIYDRLYILNM